MLIRSTDGLGHVNLLDMDMDQFREWLWPGVVAKQYMVEVNTNFDRCLAYRAGRRSAWRITNNDKISYTWRGVYHIHLRARSAHHAKRKAMAMVRDYLFKSHGPCTMTTGGNHGQE